ncbi:MAG TPA: hypothetical protein GX507_08625 [Clostridia bacterium]|nr:hypothetical protein [Clostridia bacterium]
MGEYLNCNGADGPGKTPSEDSLRRTKKVRGSDQILKKLLATTYSDLQAISERELRARALALEKRIKALKLVMPLIDVPIPIRGYQNGEEDSPWEYRYYDEPGIVLAEEIKEDNYFDADAHELFPMMTQISGRYEGKRLVLTRSGSLLELKIAGQWSNVLGEPCTWKAEIAPITAEEAVREYDDESIRFFAILPFLLYCNVEEKASVEDIGKGLQKYREDMIEAGRGREIRGFIKMSDLGNG